ncbi:MAG: aminotransferase class III-fold pyridoxal phosphate-dependent enzyme, partial [Alphaproteobacteria bacterium]|nr:aminotransferase class III-fold pyridoxal phosphate-dependent enzyme [Alphaproteobacteria bacterium]
MSHVVHRQIKTPMPRVVGGEGIFLIDENGKRYIDGCSGAAVSCLGHQNPKVIAAIKAQLDRITFGHTAFFSNEPTEKLADFLAEVAPGDLDYTCFVQGGSEAIESALKFARQYFIEIGDHDRQLFIGRRNSYHGNTYTTLAIGDNWRRWPYASMLMPVTHISACFPYREQRADESLEAYGQRTADELEAAILELGPSKVAAFIAETVVGGSLGAQ